MKRSDIDIFGSTAKTARHAADIVAAMAPPARPAANPDAEALVPAAHEATPSVGKSLKAMAPGLAGAAAGALLWKKHRVLGLLAGHALASNAVPLYKSSGKERTTILCRLATEGAGIGGALLWKDHRILGWIGGMLTGFVASSFVSGTPMNDEIQAFKRRWNGEE